MSKSDNSAAVYVKPSELKAWSRNPRKAKPVSEVAESIKRFGFAAPIVARMDGTVIAGHTRLEAAASLGLDRVPVRFMDLDEQEAAALALADNRLSELAEWDADGLSSILAELEAASVPIDGLGWDAEALRDLLGSGEPTTEPTDDAPAVDERVVHSRLGEVYELGPHRLACGDSTDTAVVASLFGSEEADIIMTDPPYCSGGFQEAGRGVGSVGVRDESHGVVQRDNLTTRGLEVLIEKAIGRVPCRGCCYVFSDWRQWESVRRAVEPLGYQFRALLVWDKETMGMGGPWRHQHELAFFGTRSPLSGWGKYGDVLRHARTGNVNHSTEKPVGLIRQMLDAVDGHVVCDPFGGSGTTLLAAASLGRVARLIELDPRYCDVIRRRWTRWARENNQDPGPGGLDDAPTP